MAPRTLTIVAALVAVSCTAQNEMPSESNRGPDANNNRGKDAVSIRTSDAHVDSRSTDMSRDAPNIDSGADLGNVDLATDDMTPDGSDVAMTRPLDEFEQLSIDGYSPAGSLAGEQPSGLAVRCLGLAPALKRAAEGARFSPNEVASLRTDLVNVVSKLLQDATNFDNGWSDPFDPANPSNYFNVTGRDPRTSDAFNTALANWCFAEAIAVLQPSHPTLALEVENKFEVSVPAFVTDGYRDSTKPDAVCGTSDCGYFRYTDDPLDANRLVKNVNVLMGVATLLHATQFSDSDSAIVAERAIRSQSREVGSDGVGNLGYFSKGDPEFDPRTRLYNSHNYIESIALFRAGEISRSENHICRAFRQFEHWRQNYAEPDAERIIAYTSCHFAKRDDDSKSRCVAWLSDGRNTRTHAGAGLLLDYWPSDSRSVEQMCGAP